MSLNCAVKLGIPDAIYNYGQSMPLSQLIASLSIHPSKTSSIQRLMRILIHSGFFAAKNVAEDDDYEVEYVLTYSSMLLLKDNPLSEFACHVPEINKIFNDAMESDSRLVSKLLLDDKCKRVFEGLKSLVDVGGGTGTIAKAVAKSFPGLECTVLDLSHVIAGLEGSDNLKYIGGDMFELIPPSDAILLKAACSILIRSDLDKCTESYK
ncbi:hypothetical protein PIB30_033737 [Stylosanthes scabra]|uniref:Uncharacterized protein n=1 Tax=Stylosanthes scabra TaxID=79078 RepID=A0ABU6QDA2_9FABA|nr:hypothetical protein [Stylosanthes scabra]